MDIWARDTVIWYWSADTQFWQLSIDHNMDVQYQVVGRLQGPKIARKCDILHWLACGADGRPVRRTCGHVTTKISWMDRKPNFLSYGAARSAFVWSTVYLYTCLIYFLDRVLLGTLKIQSERLVIFLLSRKRRPFWWGHITQDTCSKI